MMNHLDCSASSKSPVIPVWPVLGALLLAALILVCRLVIDIPNFQPVMAVALFAGYLFRRRSLGVLSVVSGMLAADAVIGFYHWRVALVVYLALLLPLAGGVFLQRYRGRMFSLVTGIAGFGLGTAVTFYLLTNLAVWAFTPWYSPDLSGLGTALLMGLPFLKWTLLGNCLFCAALFGAYGLHGQVARMAVPFERRIQNAVHVR